MAASRVVVTGAAGFVGQALCARLRAGGAEVVAAVRRPGSAPAGTREAVVGDLVRGDWSAAMEGAGAVFHLAGRAHVFGAAELDEFRRVNVGGTEAVARAAARAGVGRFVYLSSAKVNGEETGDGAFDERSPARPDDAYGTTKWEAEQAVWRLAPGLGLQATVVRTPLVYGPGVKANLLSLLRAVDRGIPLPLGGIRNRRSLAYVGNLADALAAAAAPAAAGHTLYVSDRDDVSTPELVRRMAAALGRPARLVPVPPLLLRAAARAAGRPGAALRLLGSLRVDSSKMGALLGWAPPHAMAEGLAATAAWYRSAKG
jgi:nucleoside-diphosphate-sugar epimerase